MVHCCSVRVGNQRVIVCGRHRVEACVSCGAISDRLCDWIIAKRGKRIVTCSAPICATHASSPAPDKDLCPKHAELWKQHPRNHRTAAAGELVKLDRAPTGSG